MFAAGCWHRPAHEASSRMTQRDVEGRSLDKARSLRCGVLPAPGDRRRPARGVHFMPTESEPSRLPAALQSLRRAIDDPTSVSFNGKIRPTSESIISQYVDHMRYWLERPPDGLSHEAEFRLQRLEQFVFHGTTVDERRKKKALQYIDDALTVLDAPSAQDGGMNMGGAARETKQTRMTVGAANEKAMKLAKRLKQVFFLLSGREQARQIGCSWQTWRKTTFYATATKKQGQLLRQAAKRKSPGSRPAVSLTDPLEAVTGEGEPDEVLKGLIAEQETDHEPSPCDTTRPQKIHYRKRL